MKNFPIHIILLVIAWLGLTALSEKPVEREENIAVIVSSTVDQDSISKDVLLNIYTLRVRNWDDGTRITVSDYRGSSDLRNEFYHYLGTQVNTIKKVWLRAQFTGKITPPRTVDSVDEMISLVIDNPGTIGYVPIDQVPENTTILLIIAHD